MDVRGKAPVYIPPVYPVAPVMPPAGLLPAGVGSLQAKERRTGAKVRIAFMLTLFFVVLQLHPVMNALNAIYGTLTMRSTDLANEYGCASGKGIVFTSVVFFVLALFWMRPL